jgi:hypothetical protein
MAVFGASLASRQQRKKEDKASKDASEGKGRKAEKMEADFQWVRPQTTPTLTPSF